jgi:glutamyl-tRNA synthetase
VAEATGDFVVARADGVAAYQLAVVVDDAAMGIEEVVRGDDLLPSTARQLLLYRVLGLRPPRFAHVPLVVGEDGARLAKRHGALSLGELRGGGADPRSVVGLLASLSGLAGPAALRSAGELVDGFSLARIARSPAVLRSDVLASLLPGRLPRIH